MGERWENVREKVKKAKFHELICDGRPLNNLRLCSNLVHIWTTSWLVSQCTSFKLCKLVWASWAKMQLKMRLFHVFFNGRPLNLNLKIYKKIRTVFSMFETPIQVSFSKFENLSEMKHPTGAVRAVIDSIPIIGHGFKRGASGDWQQRTLIGSTRQIPERSACQPPFNEVRMPSTCGVQVSAAVSYL